MTVKSIQKVLLVEDDREDYLITRDYLTEASPGHFEMSWADDFESALRAVAIVQPDVLLVDFQLGPRNGLDFVRAAREQGCRAPAILLTGHSSYALDLEAMKAGVADYLEKSQLSAPLLERTIRYAIERQQNQSRLEELNEALETRVRERTRELVESNEQTRQALARVEAQAELTHLMEGAFLDYGKMLDILACRVAEWIGDACVVTQLSDDGQTLTPVAFHHTDPDGDRLLEELLRGKDFPLSNSLGGRVVKTGLPVLVPDISPDVAREKAHPDLWPYLERFGAHSALIAPLRVHDLLFGTLGVIRDQPGRPYTEEDQVFLEALAGRAALWISNAALYEETQTELAERRRVEEELSEIQRGLADGVETERLKLARELHDGPIQDLYALSLQLRLLENAIPGGEDSETIPALQGSIQRVIDSLRATSIELRPPVLSRFGLAAAIRSHAEQLRKMQPDLIIHLELPEDNTKRAVSGDPDGEAKRDNTSAERTITDRSLSERARLAMFRIYQMALINIIRHAHATQAVVRLQVNAEAVLLEIQDDGVGFLVPERWVELARQGHLGLVGAVERAESLGGRMQVVSSPGEGTIIRVTLPRDA